jgi:beta-phosphoglucomutase
MNIIIPLGGKGDRFKKTHADTPKPLIPVFNRALLLHVIDRLCINSQDNIYIIYYNHLDNYNFKEIISSEYDFIKFIPIYHQTAGAAETIYHGLKHINTTGPCVLLDCDTFYTNNILKSVSNSKNKNLVFYTKKISEKPIYSYISIDPETSTIINIKEKQKISDNANTGCYVFEDKEKLSIGCKHIMDNNINYAGELYTSCVIDYMINNKEDPVIFNSIELSSTNVYSLGTPEELNDYINKTAIFLFDMDGTIINTDKIYFKIWSQILKNYNVDLDQEIFVKYIQGHSDSTVIKYFIGNMNDIDIASISVLKDKLFIEYSNEVEYIPGILEFMSYIKLLGHNISVVTNANSTTAMYILEKCGFNKFIDFIVIGNECSRPKPYPDPYIKALSNYNVNSNNKIYIFEDSVSGLLSASQSYATCIIGITSSYDNNTLIINGANLTIDDYKNPDILLENIIKYQNNNINNIKQYIKTSLPYNDISDIIIKENKLKGGFISDVIEVNIIRDNLTEECVCKLVNTKQTNLSIMAEKLGLYQRENYFYDALSRYTNINYPKFYGLVRNNKMETIGILLENMNKYPNMKLNIDLNKEYINVSLNVIKSLGKMHSKFWNKDLKYAFPELKKHDDIQFNPTWSNFIDEKWPIFEKVWNKVLSIKQMDFMRNIKYNFQKIQDSLSCGEGLTLIHGDVKSPNIFYDTSNNNNPYFLDWQYIAIGKGCQDIIFFLIESFTTENIGLYYPIFKNYYYKILLEEGVKNYSYEVYENDILNASFYFPYFVAIWFGTVPEDDLIDKNFPFFFIKKLVDFYESVLHFTPLHISNANYFNK